MATRQTNLPAGSPGFSNNNNGRVPLPPKGVPTTATPPPSSNTGGAGSGSGGTTKGPGFVDLNKTDMQSGEHFASLFGSIFGYDNIYKILGQATEQKYNSWDAQTRQTRDQYLTDMANQQQGIMNNSRNIRQQAVRTGLSKGSNVAAEVMQQMASQQQGMGVQQEYRGALNDISNQRASQEGADIFNAMAMQNELANQMGGFAVSDRSNSIQELAARMGYNSQIDSNNATRDSARMSANAMRYGADANERVAAQQLQASMGYFNALKASGVPDTIAWGIVTAQNPAEAYNTHVKNQEKLNEVPKPRPTLGGPLKTGGTTHPMGGGTYQFGPK